MANRQITKLIIAALVAMALGIATGYFAKRYFQQQETTERAASTDIARPDTLPAFTLYNLEGEAVTRDDLLAQNKSLLINFWATWCKPCREEMPLLTETQEKYKDDLVIVGIAIDNQQAIEKFLEYLGGVNYPILLGEQELQAIETANAMGVDLVGLPVSLTTDRNGKILEVHVGEVDEAEVTALVERAVK